MITVWLCSDFDKFPMTLCHKKSITIIRKAWKMLTSVCEQTLQTTYPPNPVKIICVGD